MISLYSGTPGSGKSLHAGQVIYWRLKMGKPVIANFPIDISKINTKRKIWFLEIDNSDLRPDRLINFTRNYTNYVGRQLKEGDLLLIIDECQILFNAREWNVTGRSDWLSFFTQHRKFFYDIILVAQFDRMIDRQIRSLIEYENVHRKMSNFGTVGKVISFFVPGGLFVNVKIWYPLHEKVGQDFFRAKKVYYGIYDTYHMFGAPD